MLFRRHLPRSFLKLCRQYQRSAVRNKNIHGDFTPTTLSMLDDEDGQLLYIDAVNTSGFRFHSGIRVLGPIAIFPKSVLHWNVSGPGDISEESLSLFTILEPKLDVLVLGIGERGNQISPAAIKYLRSKKINMEVLPTDQAVSTFNYLNNEKRYVAAGLIPPTYMAMQGNISDMSADTLMRKEAFFHGDPFERRHEYVHPLFLTEEREEKEFKRTGIMGKGYFMKGKELEEFEKLKAKKAEEMKKMAEDGKVLSDLNIEEDQKLSFDEWEILKYDDKTDETRKLEDKKSVDREKLTDGKISDSKKDNVREEKQSDDITTSSSSSDSSSSSSDDDDDDKSGKTGGMSKR